MARSTTLESRAFLVLTTIIHCVFLSLTHAYPSFLNTSLSSELAPQCINSKMWMDGGSFDPSHCYAALNKLEDTDFRLYKSRDIEFLAPGAIPQTKLDAVRLPRIYTSESCTIIVAMLGTIKEHFLPGQVRQAEEYGTTDLSKFSYLWSIAAWIDGSCVAKEAYLGWCATGTHSDIGVFVVGTESKVSRMILGGPRIASIDQDASGRVDAS